MLNRVVCLNCIDGRAQIPVIQFIQREWDVEHVDMITEPGMDGLLADAEHDIIGIVNKVDLSIEKNGSGMLFIIGHHDCRGNPVEEGQHKEHITKAVSRIEGYFKHIDTIGLWVNSRWEIERCVG